VIDALGVGERELERGATGCLDETVHRELPARCRMLAVHGQVVLRPAEALARLRPVGDEVGMEERSGILPGANLEQAPERERR
jgi:hypothetical protein